MAKKGSDISHYGVLGMKWGRRKRILGNEHTPNSFGESKRSVSLKRELELRNLIRKKKNQLDVKDAQEYDYVAAKINKKFNEDISEINKNIDSNKSYGRGKKIVEKIKARYNYISKSDKYDALLKMDSDAFDKWAGADSIRKQKVKAAKQKVVDEYYSESNRLYNEKVKNVQFPKKILNILTYDQGLFREYEIRLLEAELKTLESEG